MDSRLSVNFKRGGRRPKSHGAYSYLVKGTLPENRTKILKYLMAVRQGLVQDLGPTENDLTVAKLILVDRVVTKLGVLRLIEEFVLETTVLEGNELVPCLRASYLAYCNSVRLDLQALGLEKKTEAILTPYEIAEREKNSKEGTK